MLTDSSETEVNIKQFTNIFKHTTNSYKLYWTWSIIKEINRDHTKIKFRDLVIRMIALSWYTLIEYRLNFGPQDRLDQIVHYIYENYDLEKKEKKAALISKLEEIDDKELEEKIDSMCRYVPYRLLTPFFSEKLRGKPDYKKNDLIVKYSKNSNHALYKMNDEEQSLEINPKWKNYIQNNIVLVEGWIKYNLINFLQNRNPNVPAIPYKLSPSYKRKLSKQRSIWKKFIDNHPVRDIYTGDQLSPDEVSIDHFIPWSFVLHDKNWNLVPTLDFINSKKSDRLPSLEQYIDRFTGLQYKMFQFLAENKINKKIREDYYVLDSRVDQDVDREDFKKTLSDNIKPLYKIALNQGFQEWTYNK